MDPSLSTWVVTEEGLHRFPTTETVFRHLRAYLKRMVVKTDKLQTKIQVFVCAVLLKKMKQYLFIKMKEILNLMTNSKYLANNHFASVSLKRTGFKQILPQDI